MLVDKLDSKITDSEPLKELVNDFFKSEAEPYYYFRFGFQCINMVLVVAFILTTGAETAVEKKREQVTKLAIQATSFFITFTSFIWYEIP